MELKPGNKIRIIANEYFKDRQYGTRLMPTLEGVYENLAGVVARISQIHPADEQEPVHHITIEHDGALFTISASPQFIEPAPGG